MILRKKNGEPTAIGRIRTTYESVPDRVIENSLNRNKVYGHKVKRLALVAGALITVAVIADDGLTGAATSAYKGAEKILNGSNSSGKGIVGNILTTIGQKVDNIDFPGINLGSKTESAPATESTISNESAIGELSVCATIAKEYTVEPGDYVSTAVYKQNEEFLPMLDGNKVALDPLWKNYFSLDNNGAEAGNPGEVFEVGDKVLIRELAENPTDCIIG